jgi:predicted NBD/HSP70 family sugar kinase
LRHSALNGLRVETPDALVQAANAGNTIALSVLRQAGEVFGRSLANVINLLNPALILISGEGVRAGEHLFEPMRQAIRQHTFQPLGEDVDIRIESLHDDSWARGAACLVLDNIFASPNLPVPNSR